MNFRDEFNNDKILLEYLEPNKSLTTIVGFIIGGLTGPFAIFTIIFYCWFVRHVHNNKLAAERMAKARADAKKLAFDNDIMDAGRVRRQRKAQGFNLDANLNLTSGPRYGIDENFDNPFNEEYLTEESITATVKKMFGIIKSDLSRFKNEPEEAAKFLRKKYYNSFNISYNKLRAAETKIQKAYDQGKKPKDVIKILNQELKNEF